MPARFDSRDAGTSERSWAQAWPARLPLISPPADLQHLVVVAAHPDDETLGAGGLIATAAGSGVAVTLLVATDGEASHPDSRTHSGAELARLRRTEVRAALQRLAPGARLEFLGLPDSRLVTRADELAERIAEVTPPTSLIATPWSGDRHPDHAACAQAAAHVARQQAVEHWQFPIWAWHWATPQSPELPRAQMRRLRLDGGVIAAKRAAINAHRSQCSALSPEPGDEPILGRSMLAHFRRGYEVFVLSDDRPPASTAAYFDRLYARSNDPWQLTERFYERRKRDLLVASLPRERFRRAFEPGCAVGALTAELAPHCQQLVAWDGAHVAVEQTRARLQEQLAAGRVRVERGRIPEHWPSGTFDLIVLSEVGYYSMDLQRLKDRVEHSLSADGVLVACHWRHSAPDHPFTAEDVHAALAPGLANIAAHREADFLLDVWSRDGISVAAAQGIV